MDRPNVCPKCRSQNIQNLSDEEERDGTFEFWNCLDCLCEWGVQLKVVHVLIDEVPDNVIRL